MRTASLKVALVSALVWVTLGVGSCVASATEVNVANDTGFGTEVATVSATSTSPLAGTLTESVFLGSGTYTYEFSFAVAASNLDGPESFTTAKTTASSPADTFSPSLDYGQVGPPVPSALATTTPCGSTDGFCFNTPSLKVFLKVGAIQPGQTFAFYAQSLLPPSLGSYSGQDTFTFSDSNVLDPGPEPASIFLFGTGLLLVAGLFRRKLFV